VVFVDVIKSDALRLGDLDAKIALDGHRGELRKLIERAIHRIGSADLDRGIFGGFDLLDQILEIGLWLAGSLVSLRSSSRFSIASSASSWRIGRRNLEVIILDVFLHVLDLSKRDAAILLIDLGFDDGVIAASEVFDISALKRFGEGFHHGFVGDSFAFGDFIDRGFEDCSIHSFIFPFEKFRI
jgi:hypothetical protein